MIDLNFKIEVEKEIFYTPLMYAAALGRADCLRVLVRNPILDLNAEDEKSGANAFWTAAFYGRGECMGILSEAGIDILSTNKHTKTNALHLAIERKHYNIAKMLIESKFPLNDRKDGGLTALILAARDKGAYQVAETLLKAGAQINAVSDVG